ncbi:hypothetical protein CRE_05060 [Caenorhabditis remanei]|uniref:Uncharacterized protein n=1 Tax=Caenorhabditis remanei TaxID=31234 RepID=E3MZ03_CAERE|nr:hypothetical protein CRE_05060 [Caenorhabditis remanei]
MTRKKKKKKGENNPRDDMNPFKSSTTSKSTKTSENKKTVDELPPQRHSTAPHKTSSRSSRCTIELADALSRRVGTMETPLKLLVYSNAMATMRPLLKSMVPSRGTAVNTAPQLVKWSESLAETGKNMPKEWRGLQPNYRYFFVGRNKDAMDLDNKLFNWTEYYMMNDSPAFTKWSEKNENYTVFRFEPLLPLQTRIGCASVHKQMSYRGYRRQLYAEYSSQCLIGPERSFHTVKYGPPGSDCGDDDVEDGLCVSKLDGDIEAFGSPPPSLGETVHEETTPSDDDDDMEVNWKRL